MDSVGVIGVGRLGICMALCFEKAGYHVQCIEKNPAIVKAIVDKHIESHEPGVTERLKSSQHLHISPSYKSLFETCDVVFIVVPTPSLPDNTYNHEYVEEVVAEIEALQPQDTQKVVVISCTVMPEYSATVRTRLAPLNIEVCYSPEFIAQGEIIDGFENPDIVLIGAECDYARNRVAAIYRRVCNNLPAMCLMSLTESEITKIALNCYVTMKIAYANMVGDLVKRAGGDAQTVLDAIAHDSRVGDKCMKWGYGYGGPCFPRDNLALQEYAKTKDMKMILSAATDDANNYHMDEMFRDITEKEHVDGLIRFPCITYKPSSVITERSFPLDLATRLAQSGYSVEISERQCVIDDLKKTHGELFKYSIRY